MVLMCCCDTIDDLSDRRDVIDAKRVGAAECGDYERNASLIAAVTEVRKACRIDSPRGRQGGNQLQATARGPIARSRVVDHVTIKADWLDGHVGALVS